MIFLISILRVDDRLIHGQVAVVWGHYLGVNRIIVANDEILDNKVQIMALKMSVPDGVKPFFVSVEQGIKLMNNPKSANLKIMVVVNKPADALKIAQSVPNIPLINLGNYGRVGAENMKNKKQLSKNIFVTEDDEKVLKDLIATNIKVNVQPVPSDPDVQLSSLI